jgi:hypothetical protein
MSTAEIGQDLIEQIARLNPLAAVVPQVVVRVADGQVGFKRVFLYEGKPGIIGRHGAPFY